MNDKLNFTPVIRQYSTVCKTSYFRVSSAVWFIASL